MNYVVILFCLLTSVLGVALVWKNVSSAVESAHAASWPRTTGVLTSVALKENGSGDATYMVEAEYTYQVGEQTYTGSRLAIGYSEDGDYEVHEEIYRKLKNAKSAEVRYDPQNPASAVLSFGVHRSILSSLAFGILFLSSALGMTLYIWAMSGRDRVLLDNLSVQ